MPKTEIFHRQHIEREHGETVLEEHTHCVSMYKAFITKVFGLINDNGNNELGNIKNVHEFKMVNLDHPENEQLKLDPNFFNLMNEGVKSSISKESREIEPEGDLVKIKIHIERDHGDQKIEETMRVLDVYQEFTRQACRLITESPHKLGSIRKLHEFTLENLSHPEHAPMKITPEFLDLVNPKLSDKIIKLEDKKKIHGK